MVFVVENRGEKIKVHAEYTNSCCILHPIIAGAIAGEAKFVISQEENLTTLLSIERYPQFKKHGVAKAMLDVMEYMSFEKDVYHIGGLFAPSEDRTDVEKFYRRNGYDVYIDEYERMFMDGNKCTERISKVLTHEIENVKEITQTLERSK